VLLVAQNALREALRAPAFGPFAQRVGASFALEPLSADESVAFVRHQAKAAGGESVFDDNALSLLAAACGGVPRVLNRAASLALDLASGAEAEAVDVEAVMEALARLGLDEPAEPAQPALRKARTLHPTGKADQPAAARTPKQKTTRKRSA
jgi:hypothetical protein